MDYEKKHNEALEQAKKELAACGSMDCDAARLIFRLFPQLRESEDEKMMKWLITQLKTNYKGNYWANKAIEYLEKQKEFFKHGYGLYYYHNGGFTFVARPAEEENPYDFAMSQQEKQEYHIPWYDYQKSKEAGYTIVPNEEYEQLIKQKEHKPIQSNIEKEYIRTIKSLISDFIRGKREVDTGYYQKIYDWLDERHVEQNPAWSEEDEKVYSRLLNHYESLTHCVTTADRHQEIREELNFLKSICPSWKPSEDEERLIITSISFLKDFAEKGYENAVECIDWLKSKLNGNSGK